MGTQQHEPLTDTDRIGIDPHFGINNDRDKLVMTFTELHHESKRIQTLLDAFLEESGLYHHGFRSVVNLVWHPSLDKS
jgi:hypothetical protein